MSDLPIQEENNISTKFFTPSVSPRTSIEINKQQQPERLSLFRRLTLSFRRSLRHENQHDKDIAKANLDSIEKNFIIKPNDSINTEPASSRQANPNEQYCRELLNQISNLWFGSNLDRQQAFDLLEQNRLLCTMVPEFIARLAHSISKRAIDIHDESTRKSMLHEALELSKIALKSKDNSALCHFTYGHIIGVFLEKNQFPLKDKLNQAALFKYHMDKTIELDKNFYEAYAYLGRYEYTAYNLGLFERKAAAMLGYVIEGNVDKALEYLHLATKGNSDMMHTVYLLIGKIYQKKKQFSEAKKYFNMCMHIPIGRKSQTNIVNDAKILLKDKKIENSSFEALNCYLKKNQIFIYMIRSILQLEIIIRAELYLCPHNFRTCTGSINVNHQKSLRMSNNLEKKCFEIWIPINFTVFESSTKCFETNFKG